MKLYKLKSSHIAFKILLSNPGVSGVSPFISFFSVFSLKYILSINDSGINIKLKIEFIVFILLLFLSSKDLLCSSF